MDRDWDLAEEMEQQYYAGREAGAEDERQKIITWLEGHGGERAIDQGYKNRYIADNLIRALKAGWHAS